MVPKSLRDIWFYTYIVYITHIEMYIQFFIELTHKLIPNQIAELFVKLPIVLDVFPKIDRIF